VPGSGATGSGEPGIEVATGAEFTGQQSDEGEFDPLAQAEGFEELLFGVLDG
jgi:hypothetical protein